MLYIVNSIVTQSKANFMVIVLGLVTTAHSFLIFVTDKLLKIHDILSVSFISMVIIKKICSLPLHCTPEIDVFLCFASDK